MSAIRTKPQRNRPAREGPESRRMHAGLAASLLALGSLAVAGCLGEPRIEDRWTRLDILGSNLTANQALPAGSTQSVNVAANVTYRRILTGVAVAELRASSTISPASVGISPEGDRLPMAEDIDRLLAQSVSVGRATRAVTGWDHLIQRIDFTFAATVPAVVDSGATRGLFLVCYLGQGDEVDLGNGMDSLIVTPFDSNDYQVLPVGMELVVSGAP